VYLSINVLLEKAEYARYTSLRTEYIILYFKSEKKILCIYFTKFDSMNYYYVL